MVDFTKIIYGILDDHERLAILVHTSTTLNNCTIADDKLPKLATSLKSIETRLDAAVTKERKNPLTTDIHQNHDERVDCIKSIHRGLLFFIDHEDSSISNACQLILKPFNEHLKKLPNKKKSTYTRAINKFLAAIKSPEAIAAQELILMLEKIDQLTTAQGRFIQKTRERAEQDELNESPHIKDVRAEMHKIMDVMEHHIYFEQYLGEPSYDELVLKLNGRIGEIMAIAKSRHTHDIHDGEEHETSEEQDLLVDLENIHEDLHNNEEE